MFFHILTVKCNKCKSSLAKLLIHCSAKNNTCSSPELSVALLESMQPQTQLTLRYAASLGLRLSLRKYIFISDKTLKDLFSTCILFVTYCSQGLVVVWELNQERRGKPERIYVSSEHKGRKVTALCWDTAALRVFVGDHVGKVSAIKINTSKQGKVKCCILLIELSSQGVMCGISLFILAKSNRAGLATS